LKWFGNIRCQYLDEETVGLMKESGCTMAFLGFESGSDLILGHMNKKATVEAYLRGIKLLRDAGIPTFGSFVIGFPGETVETVIETIQFLDRCGVDFYRANLWYCERIAPVWRDRTRYGLEGDGFEWRHQTMNSSEAACLVEQIFQTVARPVWVPIFDFDIVAVWQLLARGYSVTDLKDLLLVFTAALPGRAPEQATHASPQPLVASPSIVAQLAERLDAAAPRLSERRPAALEHPIEFAL
jgi:anaerobic magnesium-protoporphyrin IX monomethyl ester cyclase